MKNTTKKKQQEVLEKQQVLEKTKAILKQEFVGIDSIIDQVIDNLSPWFMMPDLQDKPVVVNLWGLTGVGKTSLVCRIVELIGYAKQFFRFDLGQSENKNDELWKNIEDVYDYGNGKPVIIALDEMQHAKTLNESGVELRKDFTRIIWQLIDEGKFIITKNNYKIYDVIDLKNQLEFLIGKKVKVHKGSVIENGDLFYDFMEPKYFDIDKNHTYFVPKSMHKDLFELSKDLFITEYELTEEIMSLNEHETIRLINKIILNASTPKVVDCSKSLVFVLGNLDEAYTMSSDFNPDMNADEFHEKSLKITLPKIKEALKLRFRNEQIARLGNIHIIYPAFSSQSYKQIIQLELNKINKKVYAEFQTNLLFDESVLSLIYAEGVYPTQGTRPIYTTIHQIIKSQISKIFSAIYLNELNVDLIKLSSKNNKLMVSYFFMKKNVYQLDIPLNLSLENLRKNKKDDAQAITAVHEAGHVVLSIILMNTIPEIVFSTTVEVNSGGFVYSKFKKNFIAKKEILKLTAVYLGGMAAEKFVFGDENVTTGAENDIEQATDFVLSMLKSNGMGKTPAKYGDNISGNKSINTYKSINNQAEVLLINSLELAIRTLEQEERLLLKIAEFLSNNRSLNQKQLTNFIRKYATNKNILSLIKQNNSFYRNQLLQKVHLLDSTSKISKKNINSFDFSLNNKLSTEC